MPAAGGGLFGGFGAAPAPAPPPASSSIFGGFGATPAPAPGVNNMFGGYGVAPAATGASVGSPPAEQPVPQATPHERRMRTAPLSSFSRAAAPTVLSRPAGSASPTVRAPLTLGATTAANRPAAAAAPITSAFSSPPTALPLDVAAIVHGVARGGGTGSRATLRGSALKQPAVVDREPASPTAAIASLHQKHSPNFFTTASASLLSGHRATLGRHASSPLAFNPRQATAGNRDAGFVHSDFLTIAATSNYAPLSGAEQLLRATAAAARHIPVGARRHDPINNASGFDARQLHRGSDVEADAGERTLADASEASASALDAPTPSFHLSAAVAGGLNATARFFSDEGESSLDDGDAGLALSPAPVRQSPHAARLNRLTPSSSPGGRLHHFNVNFIDVSEEDRAAFAEAALAFLSSMPASQPIVERTMDGDGVADAGFAHIALSTSIVHAHGATSPQHSQLLQREVTVQWPPLQPLVCVAVDEDATLTDVAAAASKAIRSALKPHMVRHLTQVLGDCPEVAVDSFLEVAFAPGSSTRAVVGGVLVDMLTRLRDVPALEWRPHGKASTQGNGMLWEHHQRRRPRLVCCAAVRFLRPM